MQACLCKSIKSLRDRGRPWHINLAFLYLFSWLYHGRPHWRISFLCLCLCFSLRSRQLKVMSTGKNVARERDTRGECKRLPERPMKIVYSLSPRVSLSRAPLFPVPITSKRLLRRLRERHERRVRAPAREPRENRLLPLPSRVSLARPILSCAHYFQAPAT